MPVNPFQRLLRDCEEFHELGLGFHCAVADENLQGQ